MMNDEYDQHDPALAVSLIRSYRQLTGRELVSRSLPTASAVRALYEAPFAVLAHNSEYDPKFTYANVTAQQLFEMAWSEIIGTPSRLSAEPLLREERQRLLELVGHDGYINDYKGIRISRTGKRFLLEGATVWNLTDENGQSIGQAAVFAHWEPVS